VSGHDETWIARPYVPEAPDPGPKIEGLTGSWAEAMEEARQMHEAKLAAERAGPRHARRHVFLGPVVRAASAALIAVGTLLAAIGAAAAEWVA
jgi:hypothetical protein